MQNRGRRADKEGKESLRCQSKIGKGMQSTIGCGPKLENCVRNMLVGVLL